MSTSEGQLELLKSFDQNTISKQRGGRFAIDCKKGLWGVEAATEQEAIQEARHYFIQYYRDGEYGL